MCCHRAFIASATTACSPAKPAPRISLVPASCSQCRSSRSMPSKLPAPRPRSQTTTASLPLLRRPHDHHRDLLARTTAKAPPHTGSTSNQDRHLMMPAPSIRHRIDHLHSGSLSPASAPACIVAPHRPAAPPQIRSRNAQGARSKSIPQFFDLKRSSGPLPSNRTGTRPAQIPIALAAPPGAPPHPPRFRALALFGRRPHERVESTSCRRPKTCTKAEISSDRNQLARALVEPDFYFLFLKVNDKPLVRFGRRKQIGPIYVRPARWGVRQGERKLPLFLTLFIPDPNDSG